MQLLRMLLMTSCVKACDVLHSLTLPRPQWYLCLETSTLPQSCQTCVTDTTWGLYASIMCKPRQLSWLVRMKLKDSTASLLMYLTVILQRFGSLFVDLFKMWNLLAECYDTRYNQRMADPVKPGFTGGIRTARTQAWEYTMWSNFLISLICW